MCQFTRIKMCQIALKFTILGYEKPIQMAKGFHQT